MQAGDLRRLTKPNINWFFALVGRSLRLLALARVSRVAGCYVMQGRRKEGKKKEERKT